MHAWDKTLMRLLFFHLNPERHGDHIHMFLTAHARRVRFKVIKKLIMGIKEKKGKKAYARRYRLLSTTNIKFLRTEL